jgi:hypothetical protein
VPHNWMIEVLTDLKAYAQQNRLIALAAQLEEVRLLALTEIAAQAEAEAEVPFTQAAQSGRC